MEAFETFLPSSTRISCSLSSSLEFPKAPLGRPSSFPWAFAWRWYMNRNWPATNPTHRSITYQERTTMAYRARPSG